MTRYFFTVLCLGVALLLSGCGASRHVLKSNTQAGVEAVETVHGSTGEKATEAVTVKTDIARGEEVVTEVTEYDTALPVDPATGAPPAKKKTIQTKRAATQVQQVVTADRNTSADTFENRESSVKSDTATITEDTSRRGLNWVQGALCLAGIIAILTLIIWALAKRFKR